MLLLPSRLSPVAVCKIRNVAFVSVTFVSSSARWDVGFHAHKGLCAHFAHTKCRDGDEVLLFSKFFSWDFVKCVVNTQTGSGLNAVNEYNKPSCNVVIRSSKTARSVEPRWTNLILYVINRNTGTLLHVLNKRKVGCINTYAKYIPSLAF